MASTQEAIATSSNSSETALLGNVVAQALDNASWVRDLTYDDVVDISDNFDDSHEFEEAIGEKFGSTRPEGESGVTEDINQTHSLTIVASELDAGTE